MPVRGTTLSSWVSGSRAELESYWNSIAVKLSLYTWRNTSPYRLQKEKEEEEMEMQDHIRFAYSKRRDACARHERERLVLNRGFIQTSSNRRLFLEEEEYFISQPIEWDREQRRALVPHRSSVVMATRTLQSGERGLWCEMMLRSPLPLKGKKTALNCCKNLEVWWKVKIKGLTEYC